MTGKITTPLALDGWLEFNRVKWGVQPVRMTFSADDEEPPSIDAVLYLDKKGRVRFIPPYMALSFNPKPSGSQYQGYSQWLKTSELLIREMRRRGLANTIELPPDIPDIRPWQWAGFKVGVCYTFYIDLPCSPKPQIKNLVRKAAKMGYACSRSTDARHVIECLGAAEKRKGFSYQISIQDFELMRESLGDDHLRAYVSYSPEGEPVCALLVLHAAGTKALALANGTKTRCLNSGVNQLTTKYALEDLKASGASGFDYLGANIPGVAEAKSKWGSKLVPFYTIESYGAKKLAKWMMDWQRFRKSA